MTTNRFPTLTLDTFANAMIASESRYAIDHPAEFRDSLALFDNDLDAFTHAFLRDSRDNASADYAHVFIPFEELANLSLEEEGALDVAICDMMLSDEFFARIRTAFANLALALAIPA